MIPDPLSENEKQILLGLARQAIEQAVCGAPALVPDLSCLPERLQKNGVCFVTLTNPDGSLRGCIGALEARLPLAQDVCLHAAAAALDDYRFLPVQPGEVAGLHIEISRLTDPLPLEYERPEDLLVLIHPGEDGVVLCDGPHRATFLPQVWEKIPRPEAFLGQLCLKMGVAGDTWRRKKLAVEIYHVEEIHE